MNGAIQWTIAVLLVAGALGYWVARFVLRTMATDRRTALAARMSAWSRRFGLSAVNARRVEAKLASDGACGSCDSCRACATPATAAPGMSSFKGIPVRRTY